MTAVPRKSEVDEEYSQALSRIVNASVCFVVCLGLWFLASAPSRGTLVASLIAGGYCLFAVGWTVLVKRCPGHFVSRRAIVIVGDLGLTSFGMYMLGPLGACFYPLYLWIIVGNGMRYGPRYLYAAMGTGGLGFLVLLVVTDYWQRQLAMGIGLWIGLFVLPLFYLTLIRRLHASNTQLAAELVKSDAATTAQARLALENARLLAESQSGAAALRDKNAELDSFVHTVSHDLKSPLVTIQEMIRLVLDEHAGGVDDEGRHYLERIQVNSRRMERLVLDLLVLARIDREARVLEEVDLARVVEDRLAEQAEPIRRRGIRVVVGDLPTIRAVRVQIEQVIRNLLTNALKYMGDTPSPAIEIGAVDRGDALECWVRDTGIGIDPVYHTKIFELFQRLNEIEAEGTGVGLPIVKKIVEGAGGRIWVESAPGQGSTFRFIWPDAEPRVLLTPQSVASRAM